MGETPSKTHVNTGFQRRDFFSLGRNCSTPEKILFKNGLLQKVKLFQLCPVSGGCHE
jgi:hypothetical protein